MIDSIFTKTLSKNPEINQYAKHLIYNSKDNQNLISKSDSSQSNSNNTINENKSTENELELLSILEPDLLTDLDQLNYNTNSLNFNNFIENTKLKTCFKNIEYIRMYSHIVISQYSNKFISEMLKEEITLNDFLAIHKISYQERAKMLGWMLEIFKVFHLKDIVYFLAVNIMDRYFRHCPKIIYFKEIHLIGMLSMHLAIKIFNVHCWDLKTLSETIGKNKFTYKQLIKMESNILKFTDYCLIFPTLYDFVLIFKEIIIYNKENEFNIKDFRLQEYIDFSLLDFHSEFVDLNANFEPKYIDDFSSILNFVSKLISFDYNLIGKSPSMLAVGVINVSLTISEKLFTIDLKKEIITEKLCLLIAVKEIEIKNITSRIFYLLKTVKTCYLMEFPTFKEIYEEVQMLII